MRDTGFASVESSEENSLSTRDIAIRRVADQVHRLNHAIVQAVEAGATIELLRCSRYHAGDGQWGDQTQPIVTVRNEAKN